MALVFRLNDETGPIGSSIKRIKGDAYTYSTFINDVFENIESTVSTGKFQLDYIQYDNENTNLSEGDNYKITSKSDAEDLLNDIRRDRTDIEKIIVENVVGQLYISAVPVETYWFIKTNSDENG